MQVVHTQEVMSEGDGYRVLSEMQRDHVVTNKAVAKFDNQVVSHIDDDGKLVTDAIITILHIEEEDSNVVRSKKR
jgi:hypothetical protein